MNNNFLTPNQKKELLLQLKKEITNLEKQLQHPKLTNLKINTIKNLKISSHILISMTPFILTASLIAGIFKLIGLGFPFYYGDNITKISSILKEFDSLGNIRYEQQYNQFPDTTNLLNYYTPWEQTPNKLYTRTIETYKIKDLTEEDILELFTNPSLQLNTILGEPISKKQETKNNLSDKELHQKSYLQAIIYIQDTNDYIIRQETITENTTTTLLYILITILIESTLISIKSINPHYKLEKYIKTTKQTYTNVTKEELTKTLEIKKTTIID